jgi:hypothetical protein
MRTLACKNKEIAAMEAQLRSAQQECTEWMTKAKVASEKIDSMQHGGYGVSWCLYCGWPSREKLIEDGALSVCIMSAFPCK